MNADGVNDIAVVGATGATGTAAITHLAKFAPADVNIVVAARSIDAAEALVAETGLAGPKASVAQCDLQVPADVTRLVAGTRLVLDLAGPYARTGGLLVAECASTGTDRVDVCGEVDWLRDMIAEHDGLARKTGARFIHSAGFESLPFDLGVYALAARCRDELGTPLLSADASLTVRSPNGPADYAALMTGGSFASGLGVFGREPAAAMDDADLLNPTEHAPVAFNLASRRHRSTGGWLVPMLPSPYVNPPVVHRTAGLSVPGLFAPEFLYSEGLAARSVQTGVSDEFASAAMSLMTSAARGIAGLSSATRQTLAAQAALFAPKPRAISADDHRGWSWSIDLAGRSSGGEEATQTVAGQGPPGHICAGATAAEAALLLLGHRDAIDPGFLTPATAFGDRHLADFARAGVIVDGVSGNPRGPTAPA